MRKISEVIEEMKYSGMKLPQDKIYFSGSAAELRMKEIFEHFIPGFTWMKEYSEIAEWMENNEGKGLLMHGKCGTGKTMFGRYILPLMILGHFGLVVKCYDAIEMNSKYDEIFGRKLLSIDDIGTECIMVNYGEKRLIFSELIDLSEKNSKLLILTTNLTDKELEAKYGERVLDRIKSTTKRVAFNGKSFRK